MNIANDLSYDNLSNKTQHELSNVYENCNSNDILDYLFTVFFDAVDRNEIKRVDAYRLIAKSCNNFYQLKLEGVV